MKKIILSIILLASIHVFGQSPQERFIIYGVPQYLFTNGLRLDADLNLNNSNSWWTISPYFYSDKSSIDPFDFTADDEYNSRSYDKMQGFGLGIERRYILTKKVKSEGFYLKYGATYKKFTIEGSNFTFREYIGDDGLTYQGMRQGDYSIDINSIMGNICIGYQFEIMPKLYLDTFMGFGLKYSHHNSSDKVTTKYNRSTIDYGYTGTMFVGGWRLGVAL